MTTWRTLTRAEFDAWESTIEYPILGVNAATGKPAPPDVGPTLRIVEPLEVSKSDVRVPDFGELRAFGKIAAEPVRSEDGKLDVLETAKADVELEAKLAAEAAEAELEAEPIKDVLR